MTTAEIEVQQLLTPEERARRAELEEQVLVGVRAGIMAGRALRTLQGERLYRSTHPTFEAYGLETFGLSRARLYQLIDFAEVAEEAAERGIEISNERVARALGVVAPDDYALVLAVTRAVTGKATPSSADVQGVADTVRTLADGMQVEHPDTQEPVPLSEIPPERRVEAVSKAVQRGTQDRKDFQGTDDVKPMAYVAGFQEMGLRGALQFGPDGYWLEVLDPATGEMRPGPATKTIWDAPRAWRQQHEAEGSEDQP
ncbi:hypothetical protein QOL99_00285 [Deinococcus sp. MIMF12]|uniref:DUF222 domain-containing protein n=1 Tax=Deinococcus rhizophilus TaxID=3049544 RepID=A0ABT7JC18_9DEIO|nr:hypothetical protein [Deinococcus rhizophilus]MDL2342586.1 hypothetical protein [Deinococcus rhizophilus]